MTKRLGKSQKWTWRSCQSEIVFQGSKHSYFQSPRVGTAPAVNAPIWAVWRTIHVLVCGSFKGSPLTENEIASRETICDPSGPFTGKLGIGRCTSLQMF